MKKFCIVLLIAMTLGCVVGKKDDEINANIIIDITEVVAYASDGKIRIAADKAYFEDKSLVIEKPLCVSENKPGGYSANRWHSPEFEIRENKMIFPNLLSNKKFRISIQPAK